MARQTLVLDASVGVKWFSALGEAHVPQARALLMAHAGDRLSIMVPALFFHEIANALVHKKTLSPGLIEEAISNLFALHLSIAPVNEDLVKKAARLVSASITEYDAFYAVVALENQCPLITANPRHQAQALGCRVISIEDWTEYGVKDRYRCDDLPYHL